MYKNMDVLWMIKIWMWKIWMYKNMDENNRFKHAQNFECYIKICKVFCKKFKEKGYIVV
jgi:hypothetical protein